MLREAQRCFDAVKNQASCLPAEATRARDRKGRCMQCFTTRYLHSWSFASTLVLTLFALTARAEPAAHVEFVTGNVSISDRSNHTRPAEKGMALDQSETVMTNDGRAQIRFTDGGYFSLQPRTHFRIDEYCYSGSHDDADHVFLSLLKGGLRTISGLVGKRNRAAYRMTTPVATIGIRGTEYVLDVQSALYGHVAQGAIEVCNGAGCLIVPGGQAFFVSSPSTLPVFTEKRSVLSPAGRPAAAATPRWPDKAPATGDRDGDGNGKAATRDKGDTVVASDFALPAPLRDRSGGTTQRAIERAGAPAGRNAGQIGNGNGPQAGRLDNSGVSQSVGSGNSVSNLTTSVGNAVSVGGAVTDAPGNRGLGNGGSLRGLGNDAPGPGLGNGGAFPGIGNGVSNGIGR